MLRSMSTLLFAPRTKRVAGLALALAIAACSSSSSSSAPPPPPDPAAVEMQVRTSLEELAAFGNKRAGSDEASKTADYLVGRFQRAGLADVHTEGFAFPRFNVHASSITLTANGVEVTAAHEVFAYSGKGHVDADVVFVGAGHEKDYAGKDVTGKIVLLVRDPQYHRGAQYDGVVAHGGVAMLYVSQSPENLIQVGSLGPQDEGLGPIPAVAVGGDDGKKLTDAASAGQPVHAVIDVDASADPAGGRNVVGKIPGSDPSGAYLLVGAHYDTWFTGSLDNGTGVAALLSLADDLGRRGGRKLGLVFVAYDGEELGLYGGYDFLRKHVTLAKEKLLAFVNFEIPANKHDGSQILVRTAGPLDEALVDTETNRVYQLYAGMDLLPEVLGGIIPTDIQGMYWGGIQGATTACNSPYYHTTQDTPDKVDLGFLADAAVHFEETMNALDQVKVDAFADHDPHVWKPDVTTARQANGDVAVTVVARDANGAPQAGAQVSAWIDVDDFTRTYRQIVTADGGGSATITIPSDKVARGQGSRWIHATAGVTFPLSEVMIPIP